MRQIGSERLEIAMPPIKLIGISELKGTDN